MLVVDCTNPLRFTMLALLFAMECVLLALSARILDDYFEERTKDSTDTNTVTIWLMIVALFTGMINAGWALFEMFNHGVAGGTKDVVGDALAWISLAASAMLLGFGAKHSHIREVGRITRTMAAFAIITGGWGIITSLMRLVGLLGTPVNVTTTSATSTNLAGAPMTGGPGTSYVSRA